MAYLSSLSSRLAPKGQVGNDLFTFGGQEADVIQIQRPFAQRFSAGQVVADIGCGRGTFLQLLADRNVQAVGVDLSDQSIEICRRKGFANLVQSDGQRFLQDQRAAFDGIFCSHIIEHMPPEQVGQLIELALQALKPGGELIILTPNPNDLFVMGETFWLDPTHVRPYPLPLLRDWFQQAGFRIVEARAYMGFPLWKLGRRQLMRNLLLKLMLGRYFGAMNTLIIGRKPGERSPTGAK